MQHFPLVSDIDRENDSRGYGPQDIREPNEQSVVSWLFEIELRPVLFRLGGAMEQVDQYSYYRLGAAIGAFKTAPNKGTRVGDFIFRMIGLRGVSDDFLNSPFVQAKDAMNDVQTAIGALFRSCLKEGTEEIDFDKELAPFHFGPLSRAITEFEAILSRESPKLPIFFVPQKGIAKTDDLIERAHLDLPEVTRRDMPAAAIEEIKQAGRAVAFDLFTAHAIHMLRAAEIVVLVLLRDYYSNEIKESQRNWGQYVKLLESNGADPALTQYLNEVVRLERNQGVHPTKLLTEPESSYISTLAKGAIMKMVAELQKRQAYDCFAAAINPA